MFYATLTAKTHYYNDVFLELSGGLDSSSILLALEKAETSDQRLFAFNIYDERVNSSNELIHVERLKQEACFSLIKVNYMDCMPYSEVRNLKLRPNMPTISISHLKKEQLLVDIASSYTKNPIFINGHGGDTAFMAPPPLGSTADLILDKRFDLLSLNLHKLAIFYRTTYWQLVYNALKSISSSIFRNQSLFTYHNIAPWFLDQSKFNHKLKVNQYYLTKHLSRWPGKSRQMYDFDITLANTLVNLKGTNYNFFPFLTLPIVELALSIKTYS